MRSLRLSFCSILLGLFWTLMSNAQFFEVQQGLIDGISDNGVGAGSTFGDGQYFRWTPSGGSVGIGGVSPGGGVGGQGKISADGRFISGTTFNAAENYHEMSRYDSVTDTWTGFGAVPVIGTQIDAEVSSGWAVSGDGSAVAGLGWTSQGTADAHAFQWQDDIGPIDLGTANVGTSARVNGLNGDGSVAVGWQDGNGRQGAAWVNGVQELIFDNGGNAASEAQDVSADGQWVTGIGFGSPVGPPAETYRYNTVSDKYESIPNLAVGGMSRWGAGGITDDGKTIVGGTWGFGPATFGNAIIWREGLGTILMTDYLDGLGIDIPVGTSLAFASAISSDGTWIAGWSGFGPGGDSWVVRIPEPGSATLTLFAVGSLALLRRRP